MRDHQLKEYRVCELVNDDFGPNMISWEGLTVVAVDITNCERNTDGNEPIKECRESDSGFQ